MNINGSVKSVRKKIPRSWKKIVYLLRLEKGNATVVVKPTMTMLTAPSVCLPPSLNGASTKIRKYKPASNWLIVKSDLVCV